MNNVPEVFTIVASNQDVSKTSYDSYEKYKPVLWPQPKKIDEKSTREDSLNEILSLRDRKKDCLIFVDDIIFKQYLTNELIQEASNYDIWGGIMTQPKSEKVQNCGFRFINIDNEISYRPLTEKEFKQQSCDFFTGCFMYIKKDYLNNIKNFPMKCYNRWEEIVFMENAKISGAKVGIIDFKLSHYGNSTKKNKELKLSSISWLIERDLWNDVVKNYLQHLKPTLSLDTTVEDELKSIMESESKKIIYGAGMNTYKLLSRTRFKNIEIISGLKEEVGKEMIGAKIKEISEVNFESKKIIVTPIGYDKEILTLLKKYTDLEPLFLSLESSGNHSKLSIKKD